MKTTVKIPAARCYFLGVLLFPYALFAQSPLTQIVEGAHASCIENMAFSPDGRFFASSAADKTSIWELGTGSFFNSVPAPNARVMQFSKDGLFLAAVYTNDNTSSYDLAIWHTETGEEIFRRKLGSLWGGNPAIYFAPENDIIGIRSKSYKYVNIDFWNYKLNKKLRDLPVSEFGNIDLKLFFGYYDQYSGTRESTVAPETNAVLNSFKIAYTPNASCVTLTIGDSVLVARSGSGGKPEILIRIFAPSTRALRFSQDTSLIAMIHQNDKLGTPGAYYLFVWDINSRKIIFTQQCPLAATDGKIELIFSANDSVISALASNPKPHEVASWNIKTQNRIERYVEIYFRDSVFTQQPMSFRFHPNDTTMAVHVKSIYWKPQKDSIDRILMQGDIGGTTLASIQLPNKKEGFIELQDYQFKNGGKEIVGLCRFKDGVRCLVWDVKTTKELLRSPVLNYHYFAGWGSDGQFCWLLGDNFPNMTEIFKPSNVDPGITKLRRPENSRDKECPQDTWRPGKIGAYYFDNNQTLVYLEIGPSDTFYRRFIAYQAYLCFIKQEVKQFTIYATGQ